MTQAIKSIIWIILISFGLSAHAYENNNLTPKDHVIANLLSSESTTEQVKIAGKILYSDPKPNIDLLDIAALQVTQLHLTDDDTAAWLIKAIGQSKRNRYEKFLTDFRKKTTNKKIIKYLNNALKAVKKSPREENLDISQLDSGLLLKKPANLNVKKAFNNEHIDSIDEGDSLEAVYKKVGRPSNVSDWKTTKRVYVGYTWSGRKDITTSDFQLIYDGSGYINFHSSKNNYVVAKVIRTSKVVIDDSQSSLGELIRADGIESQKIAKTLVRGKQYSINDLDTAAQKVWIEKNSTDPYMVDAVAYLCRYIGNSKNPRYHSVLKQVVSESSTRKIRKYAKKYSKVLSSGHEDVEQYQP